MFVDPEKMAWNVSVVRCASGHVTRQYPSCDVQEQYGKEDYMTSNHPGVVTVLTFVCERSHEALHYTPPVCDRIQHCEDNTDEDFCVFTTCPFSSFRCQNGQCISPDALCDGTSNCYDGTDEVCRKGMHMELTTPPPAIFHLDGKGWHYFRQMNGSDECPLTHFQCSQGHCLPIYLRCNGVDDCPNREDEASCENYTCSGFYRCRRSKVCLHADHVCDGVFQCPQYVDELLFEKPACPDECQCQGLAFVCTANFSASSYTDVRYLDASGSGMRPSNLTYNLFLIHLRLWDCRIDTQPTLELPNLRHGSKWE